MWDVLSDDDRVLFYATVPIASVIGYGTIRRKFKQDKPLWPQEVSEKKVLWPLRFEFDIDRLLPFEQWRESKVDSQALRTLARGGFQSVEENVALEAIQALSPVGATAQPTASQRSLHNQLVDQLVEAGQLQHFIAEKEYPIDNERLDVVWRRVERSVPTFVFEVQISGDLYHALGKLKHAYDLWNSRIFLVAQESDRKAAVSLLSGTFHEIQPALRFVEVEKFTKIYELKRSLRDLEKELGLL
ncbi:MAG: hypothetical protein HYY00_05265 [Chloroflexi bacterium]|nr:hypothetical protein [Chloroflexota bacterium]